MGGRHGLPSSGSDACVALDQRGGDRGDADEHCFNDRMAGLEYSLEKHVVYLAKKPPRSFIKQVASRWGKQIVYIPLGQLSPLKLKEIRTFHVLAGKDKRDIAEDYVW